MSSRKAQYLIASRLFPGFAPAPLDQLEKRLKEMPDVEIINFVGPRGAATEAAARRVLVARMPEATAHMLLQAAGPQLVIERDHPLTFPAETVPLCADPGLALLPEQDEAFTLTVSVTGNNKTPVGRTAVYAFGSQWPGRGVTDKEGSCEISLPGESADTIAGIFVRPEAEYWSQWVPAPDVDPDGETTITLASLAETIPNFPDTRYLGWGLRAMQVDQLPPTFRGQGIKVGLIDSGVAASHDTLRQAVKNGIDLTGDKPDGHGWKNDPVGHGTFCAGIIAGRDEDGKGPRGCAPEAELIVCKLYPGGRYSDLLQALDYCIEQQVDVINLNFSGPELSELVEERLIHARMLGITCVVAAGDSARPVQGLAASPNVLAVSAIGKIGEFPPNSYQAQTVTPMITPEGYFPARFSNFGPQVGLCAPGVAVISTAPSNTFGVADGTPVAAAHVTGLAALILAHHPDFQARGLSTARNPQRVERLLQLLRQSAKPLPVADVHRTGVGLPDALRAFAQESFLPMQAAFGAVPSVLSPFGTIPGMGGMPGPGSIPRTMGAPVVPFPVMPSTTWPFSVPTRPAAAASSRGHGIR